ncbi:prefoldin subunit [Trypanosoma brucei equiperdum]|uniref:Prefoldin subunit n=1 Tax=Trypanosoma brucei equiperdum TaxID=630700 RepID=A0A3L6KT21_9TRYP|nr:prefoldin subunit [Trypanosoma brucei equiperdum]
MDSDEGEVLTGAELFYYLTKKNQEQLERCRRKMGEYKQLQDVLQCITDRCRVPVLAPVASGAAYFEATIDYTNNILVLLGDNWFTERSAKQAREIAERRLDFLRGEEAALIAEEGALAQRQQLFLTEIPSAEKAMAEVEATKQAAMENYSKKRVPVASESCQGAAANAPMKSFPLAQVDERPNYSGLDPVEGGTRAAPMEVGLKEEDMGIFDELDELTEEELLEIERELGDRIDDDELAERLMTERLIAKKERRVREEMERKRETTITPSAATESVKGEGFEVCGQQLIPHDPSLAVPPAFKYTSPGDIGFAATLIVDEKKSGGSMPSVEANMKTPKRRVRFSDAVDIVPPDEHAPVLKRDVPSHVFGDVVERNARDPLSPGPVTGIISTTKKSIFRAEMENGAMGGVGSL